MLTDTHCHLDFNKFDADRADVLQRARQAGVERILVPGLTGSSSQSAFKLAASQPGLFAAIGVHPTEAGSWARTTQDLLKGLVRCDQQAGAGRGKQASARKIVAIGEIGLDHYWDSAPHAVQACVLQAQLELAGELRLPVVIHCREKGDAVDGPCAERLLIVLEAWTHTLRSENNPLADHPGVLHSFSGSRATAAAAIGMNFYIGVTGPVTYRKDRQELVACLPLDRLLIETDAPFLAPAPMRGKRNEPALVALIADKISTLHSCAPKEAASATSRNASRLFAWDN